MESLVAGVATVQEKEVCRGERKAGSKRARESRGGSLVVVLASYGGAGGGEAGGGSGWWLERREERDRKILHKQGKETMNSNQTICCLGLLFF